MGHGSSSDRRRDRTCNLLIRSQAPCHWASRPCCYGTWTPDVRYKRKLSKIVFSHIGGIYRRRN
ncbi:uncharacterized protein N7487_009284 [Penicillium crustosum]|uniref:uncharacterized protein n=1 Tax=Penicillium crustosum TaxID=36656 RepID=UPI0023939FFA|nr:uncharacterized protein N7487_009284 [Penicillium crustosum]KAJ5394981.1 hypothetical protein N7487_009284 [Penicillium crustosum]